MSLRKDRVAFEHEHGGCGNFEARAEEFVAKAIAGEPTVIEQDGKRAVLLPCQGSALDFELDPETDRLLRQRLEAPGREPTMLDWESLGRKVRRE